MSEQPDINQAITGAEYAATSATGNASIQIYNYYYGESVRTKADKSVDAVDKNLPCPYRGLFHFGPSDAEFFFGRDVFVEKLFQATQTRNFIPILGPSGSGKSSVVLAGLVPKLQQEGNWKFTHFRPSSGDDPFYALAEALIPLYKSKLDSTDEITQADKLAKSLKEGELSLAKVLSKIQRKYPNHKVLLIADQFEELYTQYSDLKFRRCFLDCLLTSFQSSNSRSSSSTVLVATMRADFLTNALSYRPFADMLQNADIKLGAMSREELTEVIEKPAQNLGVTFEVGLVERILNDVDSEPGNLPLLEFALTELWKRRRGKQLTHEAYKAIGEVQGALARHADESYGKLNLVEQQQVHHIFIQLVRPGEGTEDTRRLATKAELSEASWELVKRLADERLVVTSRNAAGQETVEVVHEALIRNWGELRKWMDTDRSFRTWQEHLRVGMYQWQQMQRDEGTLLRGAALAEAEEKLKQYHEDLSQAEQEFIQQSLVLRDRLLLEEEERKRLKLEQARRIAFAASVAGLFLIGLSIFAFLQWQDSQRRIIEGMIQKVDLNLASNNQLDAAVEALNARKSLHNLLIGKNNLSDQVLGSLQQVVYITQERLRFNDVTGIVFSPDGKLLATWGNDGMVRLWSTQGKELALLRGHKGPINKVMFSPDSKLLATGGDDGTARLWSTQGKELALLRGHKGSVWKVVFSPDSKLLATGGDDGTARLWSTQGEELAILRGHEGSVNDIVFSPDGKRLATGGLDRTVRLWSTQGEELALLRGHERAIMYVIFSPNGKRLATGSFDGTVRLWSTQGEELALLRGHEQEIIIYVNFSPNGKRLAIGGDDGTVRLWSTQGEQLALLRGHKGPINTVMFSPDDKLLATGADDGTVRLWSTQGEQLALLRGHKGPINKVMFSPDGKLLATGADDGTVRLWSTQGEQLALLHGHTGPVWRVVFSPDSKLLATHGSDGTARLWSTQNKELALLRGHKGPINDMVFSPDDKLLATGGSDGTVGLWSTQGEQLSPLRGHKGSVWRVVFSPDGKLLATRGSDGMVRLWSTQTKESALLHGHKGSVWRVVFSPDGKLLATGDDDGTVGLWSTQGEQLALLHDHKGPITNVVFSPDGKLLATGSFDRTVRLWSTQTKESALLRGDQGAIHNVVFSPDSKLLATSEVFESTVRLWSTQTKESVLLRGDKGPITNVVFSPDGKLLATVSLNNTVRLWSTQTKELYYTMNRHQKRVSGLMFSPDGKLLATGSDDGTVRLWSTQTKKSALLRGHKGPITNVVFSPDGKLLATGSNDGTVRLWFTQTKESALLRGHKGAITNVVFSSDGKLLATGSNDGTVRLWQVGGIEEMLMLSCEWIQGYLNSKSKDDPDRYLCDNIGSNRGRTASFHKTAEK